MAPGKISTLWNASKLGRNPYKIFTVSSIEGSLTLIG